MGKREEFLFEHYRQNLNLLRLAEPRLKTQPERDDIVICPLCFRYFTIDDIDQGNLTAEHVPPDKLGGIVDILTCRECNNNHGSSLDSHLVRHIRDVDALSGTGPTYVRGTASGRETGRFQIQFRSNSQGQWELIGLHKASRTENIDAFTKDMKFPDFQFNITLQLANERKAQLGLIRSAYLKALCLFGYDFLINHNLLRLRYQFANIDEDVYPVKSVVFPIELPDEFLGLNIISNPIEFKCYFVVFDVQAKDGLARRAGVMLPGPNTSDYEMFEKLQPLSQIAISLRHCSVGFRDKLDEPILARKWWNSVNTTDM